MRPSLTALTIAALALVLSPACTQPRTGQVLVVNHQDGAELAFKPDFGLILVPVTIAGQVRDFALDTGANYTVLNSDWAGELGLPVREKQVQRQPGGTIEIGKVRDVSLELGSGITLQGSELLAAPMSDLAPLIGRELGGILGHDLIEQCVLEIDYAAKRLRMHEPSGYDAKGGTVLPLEISGNEPGVRVELELADGSKVAALPALDTGSTDFISFTADFAEKHPALTEDRATIDFHGFAFAGETTGRGFALPGLRLGPHAYRHVPTGYVDDEATRGWRFDGLLGGGLLRRFTVVLDYSRSQMTLLPGPDADTPFLFDLAGLILVLGGGEQDRVLVHQAFLGGAAAREGVEGGDILVSVDGRPALAIGLPELWELFRSGEGEKHRLGLQRDGKPYEVELTKQRHHLIRASEVEEAEG